MLLKWFGRLFARRRRADFAGNPFPPAWAEILDRRFPVYRRLSPGDRARLEAHILWFVAEKHVEGCAGLEVTDEIRVTIAAQACLLLLHRPRECYKGLRTILVYPSTYYEREFSVSKSGIVDERLSARYGEAWQDGPVVLAWNSVTGGASVPDDGENVVYHEFAHKLDQEDGEANGLPLVGKGKPFAMRYAMYSSWARVFAEEFARHRAELSKGSRTVIGEYGARNPAEFFAVVTECFFEKPLQLRRKHPELYAALMTFYRLDPATWLGPPPAGSPPEA